MEPGAWRCPRPLAGLLILCFLAGGGAAPERAFSKDIWFEKPAASLKDEAVIAGTLFRRLAEETSPAVVNIISLEKIQGRVYRDSPQAKSPSGAAGGEGEFQERGEGSGFIIHPDGYVLTNSHVVLGSDAVQVKLSDGSLYLGKPVGIDPVTDVALIKIDGVKRLPHLFLGSSDKLRPGDWVLAIGTPFGLDLTVTAGIVSAKGRSLGDNPFDDFIQIDAPINPGNSGGPLINTRGEVVGINTAVLSEGQGLGFSLPIDLVKTILPQLMEKGRVIRSWFGIVVQDINLSVKESLKISIDSGALVREVEPGSPAAKSGLLRGDVIVRFNGVEIKNSGELPKLIANSPAGKKLPIEVVRGGRTMKVQGVLEEIPPAP